MPEVFGGAHLITFLNKGLKKMAAEKIAEAIEKLGFKRDQQTKFSAASQLSLMSHSEAAAINSRKECDKNAITSEDD